MPRTINAGVYDFQVPVEGCPSSPEEYDQMAKQAGACVDTAVDNDLQHLWKGSFRKKLREALSEHVAPEEGERDKAHYLRAKALISSGDIDSLDSSGLVELRNSIAATVNYSTGGGSASRIGQEWMNKAAKYLEQDLQPDQWAAFVGNITSNNPGYEFEMGDDGSTPTQESIALALKTEDARVRAGAEEGLFGG